MPEARGGGFHFKVAASLLAFHLGGKRQGVLSSNSFIAF